MDPHRDAFVINLSNRDTIRVAMGAKAFLRLLLKFLELYAMVSWITELKKRHRRLINLMIFFVNLSYFQGWWLFVLLLNSRTLPFTFYRMPVNTAQVNCRNSWAFLDL